MISIMTAIVKQIIIRIFFCEQKEKNETLFILRIARLISKYVASNNVTNTFGISVAKLTEFTEVYLQGKAWPMSKYSN